MQNKELLFNKQARSSMLRGMEILANAVSSTLGPGGQCVVIDDYIDEKPLITKDGVTVARNIQLKK
jgi:chaperonin GroEL